VIDPDAGEHLGKEGTDAVARWYTERGYQVSAVGWQCRDGEIDLVLRDGRRFVFCEVSDGAGAPAPSSPSASEGQMWSRRVAARWLEESAPVQAREIRFDVAQLRDGEVEITEGAY
jgi:putative endonuclease